METVRTGLGVVVGVALLALVAMALIAYIARRYKIASPSEAFIVVGRKGKAVTNPATGEKTYDLSGQKVVMGGGVFVTPLLQRVHSLSLSSRRITVQIRGAVSKQGIRLNLDAVAIVKVGGTEDSVRAAAQRFLTQQDEIDSFTQEVLAGSLRSIVGTLTVDEIIRDRAAFATQVAAEAVDSLNNQGLVLDTFQIQDVTDDSNYLADLGRPEAAEAAKKAAIAEADATREAAQRAAEADALTAQSQRDLALRRAAFKAEQDRATAEADAAGELARAEQAQKVLTEQELVAQRQAALKERELDTDVRKPADAARYRVEQEAQSRKTSSVADAEAAAERVRLSAQADATRVETAAEADATRVKAASGADLERRRNQADAVRLEGEAEAASILAKGNAESEALSARAEALARYGDAAKMELMINMLPKMAAEIARPMSAISDLTVISNDGAGALAKSVGTNLQETFAVIERTTGLDLAAILGSAGGLATPPKREPDSAPSP